ncbi:MAG: NUDIX domain-containing protein [Planctomycetes bacterium]|nr:NUDIX domain-containing protein [Planctomycetota bacterium]
MDFDPTREPATPRDAATVILLRADAQRQAEVFLLRRHRGASFMAQSFVFPGGIRDEGEDLRRTAARELFEEAGVLLADRALSNSQLETWRTRQAAGEVLEDLLSEAQAALSLEGIVPFAHWITPSAEKRRYSALFFVGLLPEGQTPSFDAKETVDELWITPRAALERAAELLLPPPQIRCLEEIATIAEAGPEAVLEFAREREAHLEPPIVPRYAEAPDLAEGFMLLLPWDPDYETLGQGLGEAFWAGHPLGGGPSRFTRQDGAWRSFGA